MVAETRTKYCFISHKYGDPKLDACKRAQLPNGAAPFIFPRIDADPSVAVTSHLIDAIQACESLVYLDTPLSLPSFWVGFERNYAARLGKPVHAFHPQLLGATLKRDMTPAIDPLVSVLFNLAVPADNEKLQLIRQQIWDRHNFEIRGDKWRLLDNEPRQMIDSINGRAQKFERGGVALLFLSNDSITNGFHDYVDPFTARRAHLDCETQIGHTEAVFNALPPTRTLTIWLDEPDRPRIEAELATYDRTLWGGYISVIRDALAHPRPCVAFQDNGDLHRQNLDDMIVRTYWAALQVDAGLARDFRARLTERETRPAASAPSAASRSERSHDTF
jgi:hypothetical protein